MADNTTHRIFMSYRRAEGYAPWVHQLLAQHFSGGEVFRDVQAIEGGEKWADRLNSTLTQCDVILVVIGPGWLKAIDEQGRRRLDDPQDVVRRELEAGLEREIPVIPVIVGESKVPARAELPEKLQQLCDWQAVRLSEPSLESDLSMLISAIEKTIKAPPAELLPGTVFASHKIEQEIGRGGMAVVYRGRHVSLNRVDAIKVIAPDLAREDGFRHRFVEEGRIASSLKHPNVLTVYDAGQEQGLLYLSMELVEGRDLATVLAQEGPLAPNRAVDIAAAVANALGAAHEHGLVHRDVKPANVMIAVRAGGEHVYLGDFGLARDAKVATGLTTTGHWIGTADYVAPEQVMGEAVDGRADIYSLGCVMFEMLTGHVPYEGATEAAKLVAHADVATPSVRAILPEIPAALDAVVAKAMARRPADRYASVQLLRDAARAALKPPLPEPNEPPAAGEAPAEHRPPKVLPPPPPRVLAASMGQRFKAALVDWLGAFIILSIVSESGSSASNGILSLVIVCTWVAYFVLLEGGRAGQTFGKRIFHIRVVDVDDGGPIGYRRAFIRLLGRLLSASAIWLGYVWMAYDPRRQTWHDKFAKDVVISTN